MFAELLSALAIPADFVQVRLRRAILGQTPALDLRGRVAMVVRTGRDLRFGLGVLGAAVDAAAFEARLGDGEPEPLVALMSTYGPLEARKPLLVIALAEESTTPRSYLVPRAAAGLP
jgi:hypothetical protein